MADDLDRVLKTLADPHAACFSKLFTENGQTLRPLRAGLEMTR